MFSFSKKLGVWLGLALIAVYLLAFQTYRLPLYHENFIGNLQPFGPLTQAHSFSECLTLPHITSQITLSNFQVLMATYARQNTSNLLLNFYDGNPTENQPLEQYRINSASLGDNKPLVIDLHGTYTSQFCFKILTNNQNASNSPTVWLNADNRSIITLMSDLTFINFLRGIAQERNLPFLPLLGSGIIYLLVSLIFIEKLLSKKSEPHE